MDKIIHCSVQLECKPDRAFEMFTKNEFLEAWLVTLANVEPIVGGKYELFWEPEDRENNSTIGCRITGIEPGKFVSFEWRSPKQYKHFANNADPLTHVVVFFVKDGKWIDVQLLHSGWRSSAEWEAARQWQERAWSGAFERLDKLVNDGSL